MTVRCPDARGLTAAAAAFIADERGSIVEAHQHLDEGQFFMRLAFDAEEADGGTAARLRARFGAIAARHGMAFAIHDGDVRPRTLILVSRFGHCLQDLLNRWRAGQLATDIVGVVSNHDDMRGFVDYCGLPFHHLPVARATRDEQEARIMALVDGLGVDLVVLARYMQILSPALCARLAGRCINIHHSFLPGFRGARPYHQAHARGVKIIGATAHYVTTDLDEGPIIEQDVRRVSHARRADDLVVIGQEVEASVLRRAVEWHLAHRVMVNGGRTIVFE